MIRLLLILPVLLLAAHPLVAQSDTHPTKTLLWKIEGNGMQEPSYLYGTMHVQDRRAFDLADSVLVAFSRCHAFAAELQLDSAITWFLREGFTSNVGEESVVVEGMESSEEPEEGTTRSNRRRTPRWMKRMMENTDDDEESAEPANGRETFLDAWFFRLAKLEEKEIIGIETVREQVDVFDGTSVEEEAMQSTSTEKGEQEGRLLYERMVRTYRQGDLDALLTMMEESGMSQEYFDRLLTRRNHIMAERIDTMIRKRSIFIAVGAGHLPGNEGLLSLLRKRGYQVEPVPVTRTGLARNYHEPDRLLPWFHHADTARGYQIDLPLEPVELPWEQMASGGPLGKLSPQSQMAMTVDISTMTAYITAVFELAPGYLMVDRDAAIESMLGQFGSGSLFRTISRKHVSMEGAEGYELSVTEEGMQMRSLILTRGHTFYMLLAMGTPSQVAQRDIERFISSYTLFPRQEQGWASVSDVTGGFTIQMPGEVRRDVSPDEKSYRVVRLQSGAVASEEIGTGASYVVAWGDQTFPGAGYNYTDSMMIAWGINQLAEQLELEADHPVAITYAGSKGTEVMLTHESGSSYRVRLFMRGNRLYWLLAGGPDDIATRDDADRFFNSFAFTPPQTTAWEQHSFDTAGFTLLLPGDPIVHDYRESLYKYSSFGTFHVIAKDSSTGSSYTVTAKSYSRYARESSVDSVLIEETEYPGEGDSLTETRTMTMNGHPAREVVATLSGSGRGHRVRTVLDGATVYRLEAVVPTEELRSSQTEQFFASLAITDSTHGDLFSDKFHLLLDDLMSADTTRHGNAATALRWYAPSENEYTLLHQTLRRVYRKRSDSLSGARRDLLSLLSYDSNSVDLIRELLPAIPQEEQEAAADVLVSINTRASLRLLTDVLTAQHTQLKTWDSYLLNPLRYQPVNTSVMYPRIMTLLDVPNQVPGLLALTATALDSGALAPAVIATEDGRLRQLIRKALDEDGTITIDYDDDPEAYMEASSRVWQRNNTLQDGVRCLAWLPRNDSTVRLLRELLTEDENDTRREAILALMRLDEDVPDYLFSRLLAKPFDRLAMYRVLEPAGMVEKFPIVYRTQEKIAEGLAMEWLYDDEATPETIRFVEEREMPDGRYFVYKFRFDDDDDTWYAAVVGPQPLDSTRINTAYANAVTNYDRLDAMSIEQHIQAQMQRRRN